MTQGLHLLHKPVGPTSFSLVQSCITAHRAAEPNRRPRLCHGGTLDPFAHGLLLILAGQATKLFDHLHAIPKTYEGTIRWGVETDNGDPLGTPITTGDSSTLSTAQLDDALASFVGWRDQIPPATSNKRVGGERAYVRAHRGETVDLPPSRVYLHEGQWLGHDLPRESRVRLVVRGGYYVRALVRDLGRTLGCGAHLGDLRRTAIGPYADPGPGRQGEAHGRDLLPWAPSRLLSDPEIAELRRGESILAGEIQPPNWPLPPNFPDPDAPVRGFHDGRLLYLLRSQDGRLAERTSLGGGL